KLGIKILAGAEVNIMANGNLDLSDKYLAKLDFVIASVHSGFRQEKDKMTQRIIKAISNTNVNVLGHPTGRLIEKRSGIEADWEKIFKIAAQNKVAMEINAQADRLDLNDSMILLAQKYGIKFIISTDSHNIPQLNNIRYGVAMARRGWCEKKDILNTLSLNDFIKALNT
ncbi:MAG: PHP domain-containing protein, partial [Patescibacteria group bacterium]|nr:PHP domain-containing protein [Patescibacteria group bacterium]